MKKFLALSALLAVAIGLLLLTSSTPRAGAQANSGLTSAGLTTVVSGGTNKATALSTNAYFRIDVPRADNVALYCEYKFLNAPGAGDATSINIDFYRAADAANFETNKWFTWTVAGNSTTVQSEVTNLVVNAIPYLRARVINLSTNAHATNLTVGYNFKR